MMELQATLTVIMKYNEFNIYTERLLSNLRSSNLVNTIFYLVAIHKLGKNHLDIEVPTKKHVLMLHVSTSLKTT